MASGPDYLELLERDLLTLLEETLLLEQLLPPCVLEEVLVADLQLPLSLSLPLQLLFGVEGPPEEAEDWLLIGQELPLLEGLSRVLVFFSSPGLPLPLESF